MKIKFNATLMVVFGSLLFTACKKDNYDAPGALLSGRLVYNGEPIQVENDQVPFQLYQYGFGRVGPITTTITSDGKFSQMVFDGEYKFVISPGQGPFLWPQTGGKADSITINVSGNTTLDIEVTPYYLVKNPTYTVTGRNLNAAFTADKIITNADAKEIERVNVYISKTQFSSGANNIAAREYAVDALLDSTNINFNKFIFPQSPTQDYFFVRLGIKIAGVEDMIFSPVQKVDLAPIEAYTRVEAETSTVVGGASVFTEPNSSRKWVENIAATGSGIDVSFNAPTAGSYVINIGGGTDVKGSTHTVYIDGNAAAAKTVLYPKQGGSNFDISPTTFDLSAGQHTISIRKNATDVGQAQIDWVDFFKYK